MCRTAALSRDVAAALAERLDEVAPAGFTVTSDGASVLVHRAGLVVGVSSAPGVLDEDGEGLPEERVGGVAAAVLSGLQDDISESLTEPWPVLGGIMVNADARQSGDVVDMWFGDEQGPAIRLRPLVVAWRD